MNAWWTEYIPRFIREWLSGRQHLQVTIGNAGWLIFDRMLRMVLGITIGAWVARYLGPGQFGELTYIISFIAFFQVIARLETADFVVRDIVQDHEKSAEVLGTALMLRLLTGVISWALAVFFMFLIHRANVQLIVLTAIVGATLVFQASDTIDLWFQSQNQNRRTVLAKMASYIFANGIKVLLLLAKAPLAAFAIVVTIEAAALSASLMMVYRHYPTLRPWQGVRKRARALLNQCWPFVVSGLMITTYLKIDQIMLKEMIGDHDLGIYSAAISVSQVWTVIPSALLTTLWPFVARKKQENEEAYQDALVKIFRLFAIVASGAAALTALSAPWIVRLLYGAQYQEAAVVLSIHVFVNIFVFQNLAQNLWFVNNNKQRVVLPGTLLAAVVSIIANLLLIRSMGIRGAAFSILLTEGVAAVVPCLLQKELAGLYRRAFIFRKTGEA